MGRRPPNRAGAICGQILPWDEKETVGEWARPARVASLWDTSKEKPSGEMLKERVQVDNVDFLYWRLLKDHKFTMFDQIHEWPSSEARALTMTWKTKRMERRFAGLPKLEAVKGSKPSVRTQRVSIFWRRLCWIREPLVTDSSKSPTWPRRESTSRTHCVPVALRARQPSRRTPP